MYKAARLRDVPTAVLGGGDFTKKIQKIFDRQPHHHQHGTSEADPSSEDLVSKELDPPRNLGLDLVSRVLGEAIVS